MPKMQRTGAKKISFEEAMALLNFTKEEVMRLIELKVPHGHKVVNGQLRYHFFDKELLAVVTPRSASVPLPESEPETATEEPEDEPIETVRPDPLRVPSMEDKKTDPEKVEPPPAAGKTSKPTEKPTKKKTAAKPKK